MPLLAATNLHYTIGQRVILDGLTFGMEPGERVGLVGRNGCGKTTLMKIVAGALSAEAGEVSLQRGSRAGYLSQDPMLEASRSLREEAGSAFVELNRLHAEADQVFHAMETAEGDELDRLMKRHESIEKRLEAAGGYAVDHKIDAILHGLGFTDSQFGVKVGNLSGGQKGRLALAKLLLEGPDLLLLDEPTNHLDIAGREWLESFLTQEYRGAVLMVSHDRYMLDSVVSRIVEIERGRTIEYPGNYSAFCELRYERRLSQMRAYENQQTKFRHEEAYIRKYKAGQRAKQAQGRLSKLERAKRDTTLERPVEFSSMKLELPKAPRSGDQVAIVRGASKKYILRSGVAEGSEEAEGFVHGEKTLFHDLNLTISRGERWGVIGPNGAGKTSLVRAILGQLPLDSGVARLGASVAIGYFSQMSEEVPGDMVVWQFLQAAIKKENPGISMSEQAARNLAGAFLFGGDDQEKLLGVMSGGERSRARLAALLASAKNVLILDEPTNHLDISSAERLEEAIALPDEDEDGYEGTVILISHDRALIDSTCDHLLVLDGHGGCEVFVGNYTEWHRKQEQLRKQRDADAAEALRRQEAQDRRKREQQAAKASSEPPRGSKPAKGKHGGTPGGLSWMPAEKLEAEINRLNKRLVEIDTLLDTEEVYRDRDRCTSLLEERGRLAQEQERHEEEWLRRDGG
ncbi:MAG: ABC-F family ATP-binding cassette domain-containing protein [Phycisphaeraceae bacterium]|nr:ABC-F family ATP-binding cassette domain-containing protein [Phycisphaeraceae bacterium]